MFYQEAPTGIEKKPQVRGEGLGEQDLWYTQKTWAEWKGMLQQVFSCRDMDEAGRLSLEEGRE